MSAVSQQHLGTQVNEMIDFPPFFPQETATSQFILQLERVAIFPVVVKHLLSNQIKYHTNYIQEQH